jgi:hypothetical protein
VRIRTAECRYLILIKFRVISGVTSAGHLVDVLALETLKQHSKTRRSKKRE